MGGTLFLIAVIGLIVGLIAYRRYKRSAAGGETFGRPISLDKGGYNPPPTPEERANRPPDPAPLMPGTRPTFTARRTHVPPQTYVVPPPTAAAYDTLRNRQDVLAQQEADLTRRRNLLAQQQADDNFITGLTAATIIVDEISAQSTAIDQSVVISDPNDSIVPGGGSFGGGGASADWVDPTPQQPDPTPAYQPDPEPAYQAPDPQPDPPSYDAPSYDPPSYDPPDTSSYSSDS